MSYISAFNPFIVNFYEWYEIGDSLWDRSLVNFFMCEYPILLESFIEETVFTPLSIFGFFVK